MGDFILYVIVFGYCAVVTFRTASATETDYRKLTSGRITGLRVFNVIGLIAAVIFIIIGIGMFYEIFQFLSAESLKTKISSDTLIEISIAGFICLIGGVIMLLFYIHNMRSLSEIVKKREADIVRYCLKCGTGLFSDMTHCPKCGQSAEGLIRRDEK